MCLAREMAGAGLDTEEAIPCRRKGPADDDAKEAAWAHGPRAPHGLDWGKLAFCVAKAFYKAFFPAT